MFKTIFAVLVSFAFVAISSAYAEEQILFAYVPIVSVTQLPSTTTTQKVCERQAVDVTVDVQDQAQPQSAPAASNPLGMLIGGVLGGLTGTQVGGGNGRLLATVAGGVAGAYAGDKIANPKTEVKSVQAPGYHQETHTGYTSICRDVNTTVSGGYNVVYKIGTGSYSSHVANKPQGKLLQIKLVAAAQ